MNRSFLVVIALTALLLATSATAAPVRGVVISTDGQPVAGAEVRAYEFESTAARNSRLISAQPEQKPAGEATTDAKGKFSIELKSLPAAQLSVTAPGHAPAGARAAAGDDLGAIALVAAPPVRGTITAGGKPVSNAVVVVSGGGTITARTDGNGSYTIPDPAKWAVAILVLHPEYARYMRTAGARDRVRADHALSGGVTVRGTVLRSDRRTPASGAKLFVDGWSSGVTADDGTFTIERVPSDWKILSAVEGDMIALASRGATGALTMSLRPGSFITGVVREATAAALPGVPVGWIESGDRFTRAPAKEAPATDAKGRFRIGPLAAGSYSLTISFPGYLELQEEIGAGAGESVDRTLTVARGATIEGFVRDEDKAPIAGVAVTREFDPRRGGFLFFDRKTYTDPDGRFLLRPLEAEESLELTATKKGLPTTRVSGISLSAGERKRDVVITVPRGLVVPIRVVDAAGRPIRGAEISAREVEDETRGMRVQRMMIGQEEEDLPVTSNEGAIELRLKRGRYDIAARAKGFAANEVSNVEVVERMRQVDIVLSPGVEITGRVVTSKGTPVEGANVTAVTETRRRPVSTTTAADGSFVLADLAPGQVMLGVTKPDAFVRINRSYEAPASDVVIEVPAGGQISGRVVDKATKRPITDFTAGISGEQGGGGMRRVGPPMLRSFHSDDGTFVLENVPAGRQVLLAIAPGYVRGQLPDVEVVDGKAVEGLEIALDTGVRLIGRVTGPDGAPVEGVRIGVRSEGERNSPLDFGGSEQTDAAGDYAIDAVEAGEKIISFSKEGFVTERKSARLSGKETRVDAKLSRGLEVTGTVVSESGVPIADANVMPQSAVEGARWQEVRTDGSGTFRFSGMAPGRYSFRAAKGGYPDKVLRDVDIAVTPNVRIVLEAGGVIYGRVSGFRPEDASSVRVVAGGGNSYSETRIDPSGNYRLEGAPTGSISVYASVSSLFAHSMTPEKRIELAPGTSAQVDLEFGAGSTVEGRVTRDDRPVSGARLMLQPKDRRISSMGSAMTTSDGAFSISGVQDGEYDLTAVDMQTMASFSVACRVSGTSRCDVEMRGSPLRGKVSDASTGEPIDGASITLLQPGQPRFPGSTTTDIRGAFSFDSLAPGTYQARAEKKGYGQQILDVVITEAPPQDLAFALAQADGLRLRVVDGRDGRSISAMVRAIDAAGRVAGDTYGGGVDGVHALPLSPGVYRLTVAATGFAPQNLRVTVPSAELRLGLTPGGRVVIRSSSARNESAKLLMANGEPYLRGRWDPTGLTVLEPGANTFETFAAGSYTLVVLDDAGNAKVTKPFTVVEGQTTEVGF